MFVSTALNDRALANYLIVSTSLNYRNYCNIFMIVFEDDSSLQWWDSKQQ